MIKTKIDFNFTVQILSCAEHASKKRKADDYVIDKGGLNSMEENFIKK